MNIYEQQLNKILNPEGCEKRIRYQDISLRCGGKVGDIGTTFQVLCPTCQKIQKAQKETLLMCAKDELEFLEDWTLPTFNDTPERKYHNDRINTRISQLQEVIKKLEEMK